METLIPKTNNKNWHLHVVVAYGVLNNELIFHLLVTGIKRCAVRKWIKALTFDKANTKDCGNLTKQCKCLKKNYLQQCAQPLSVMQEIRSQGKILTRNCFKEICQDFQSSWRFQIRWKAINISYIQELF